MSRSTQEFSHVNSIAENRTSMLTRCYHTTYKIVLPLVIRDTLVMLEPKRYKRSINHRGNSLISQLFRSPLYHSIKRPIPENVSGN